MHVFNYYYRAIFHVGPTFDRLSIKFCTKVEVAIPFRKKAAQKKKKRAGDGKI